MLEWLEPLMAAGLWTPELVEAAGGKALLGRPGEHAETVDWEEIAQADPELLVLTPCGYSVEQTLDDLQLLTEREGFQSLPAVRNDRVYAADGDHYFNRPGPRLVDSAEILAEIFHPDEFDFAHGEAWCKVEV